MKLACLLSPAPPKILGPVQARSFGREVGLLPGVVGLVDVLVLRQGQMFLRDGVLQRDNALGACVRVGESRQLEHGRDVRLILGADVTHVLVIGQVVLAIRQLQPALHDVGGVVIGIVEAGSDPQSKQVRGMEVGVVQRVNISAQSFSQSGGQLRLVADGGDGFQMRLDRSQTLGFDAGLVHVRVVEIGNLACARAIGPPLLAASSISAAVRLSLKSASVENTPIRDRSGGISVRLIQSPLQY